MIDFIFSTFDLSAKKLYFLLYYANFEKEKKYFLFCFAYLHIYKPVTILRTSPRA